MSYYISLGFGVGALIFWIASIQRKEKERILFDQSIANILYAVQYSILTVFSAAMMNGVSVIRSIVFYRYEKKNEKAPKWVLGIFVVMILIIAGFTCRSVFDTIPIIISLGYAYSMWQTNLVLVRFIYIGAACLWVYYNFKVRAYTALIGNAIEIVSGITALIRYREKQEEQE